MQLQSLRPHHDQRVETDLPNHHRRHPRNLRRGSLQCVSPLAPCPFISRTLLLTSPFLLTSSVGYRKDIYEAEIKKKKNEEAARVARLAAEAEEPNDDDPNGGGSDDEDSDDNSILSNGNAPPPPPPSANQDARRSNSVAAAGGGEGENVEKLRLTLRGPHGEAKFMVKTTTKISSLLKNYGSKKGLTKEIWESLSVEDPDGETMDNEKTIGDYEVEDDDMLSVT